MGGSHHLHLGVAPNARCKLVLTLGPHCLASCQFSHIINITMAQSNNITRDTKQIFFIYIIYHVIQHYSPFYSHSHSTSLTADPHSPCNPGATMVVLCKRFCIISLPVWPGNLNLPPLMCDSQYAQNPRYTYSIQPINQVTSCWFLHA